MRLTCAGRDSYSYLTLPDIFRLLWARLPSSNPRHCLSIACSLPSPLFVSLCLSPARWFIVIGQVREKGQAAQTALSVNAHADPLLLNTTPLSYYFLLSLLLPATPCSSY
jgi:hypothetical protein